MYTLTGYMKKCRLVSIRIDRMPMTFRSNCDNITNVSNTKTSGGPRDQFQHPDSSGRQSTPGRRLAYRNYTVVPAVRGFLNKLLVVFVLFCWRVLCENASITCYSYDSSSQVHRLWYDIQGS